MAGSDIVIILGKGGYKSADLMHQAFKEVGLNTRELGIRRGNNYIIKRQGLLAHIVNPGAHGGDIILKKAKSLFNLL